MLSAVSKANSGRYEVHMTAKRTHTCPEPISESVTKEASHVKYDARFV